MADGPYRTWEALGKLFGDIDPDSKFGSEGSVIITGKYVDDLIEKELEVRKLVLEHIPECDHAFVFHHMEHIVQDMKEIGSCRNIWTMPGERAMGGQVRKIHSKSNPTANLAAVVSMNSNSRAQAGFVQLGDNLLDRFQNITELERPLKKIKKNL